MENAVDPPSPAPSNKGKGRIIGETARAVAGVRGLRSFVWALVGLSALSVALLLLRTGSGSARSTAVNAVGIAIGLAVTVFLTLAALFIERKPFAWSLSIAIVMTLLIAASLVGRMFPGVLPIMVCVMAWIAVPKALALERLLAKYPDLRYARRIKGEI